MKIQNELPDFILKRMDAHYSEMIAPHGRNPFHGKIPGPEGILLNGNDYLRLSNNEQIKNAQIGALRANQTGPQQSGVFLHSDQSAKKVFEKEMAAFLSFEDCEMCQTGYNANVGLVQAIAGPDVPVYIDMLAHFSFFEGIKSAGASARVFRHNSASSLRSLVQKHGPGVIIVDSLYSTTGDQAPLHEIVEIGCEFRCACIIDESHALGVYGPNGRGLVAELGLGDKTHFISASLAKAFVTRAGLIAGPSQFMEYFRFTSFPAIFSSVVEPWEAVRARKVLEMIRNSDLRRKRLHEAASYLRSQIKGMGYPVSISNSPIIPLIAGSESRTIRLIDYLEENEIFGSPFCRPATPKNRAMVRLSLHCELNQSDLKRIIEALMGAVELLRVQDWPRIKIAN